VGKTFESDRGMTHILKPTVSLLFRLWGPSHRVLSKYVLKIVIWEGNTQISPSKVPQTDSPT